MGDAFRLYFSSESKKKSVSRTFDVKHVVKKDGLAHHTDWIERLEKPYRQIQV